ncbi:MAG: sigma-70 family RNA polymerase sigma factor, partial [Planctomycetes bacterium]|nr:sigma-70 family RNA polymerase sigma factor [Planctomycetota bacterium]
MAPSDQTLLEQFASTRDGGCFAELVRRHSGMVYGVCRRVLRDGALAEDAAQETFLLLMRQPAAVSESVAGWLHRVAHRKAVDLVRREVGHARRVQPAAPVVDDEPTWATLSPLLDEALQELPEDLRRFLVSHYLEARSQQELAEELGISQPTVSRRLTAGVAQLRSLLMAKGVVSAVLIASLLHGSLCAAAPATLTVELGKMALAGQAGLGLGVAKVGTVAAKTALAAKTMWLAAAALVVLAGAGAVARAWVGQRLASATAADWRFIAPGLPAQAAAPAPAPPSDVLGEDGPAHLLALTRLGGAGDDEIIGVAIAPDWTVLVAGNATQPVPAGTPVTAIGSVTTSAERSGFIARYAPDGRTLLGCARAPAGATFTCVRSDARGDLLVAGHSDDGCDLGGGPGRGGFIAKLSAATCRPLWILYEDGIVDYAADARGDLLVLRVSRLTR